MSNHSRHDNATSNVLAWSPHSANVEPSTEEDASVDADEPPDPRPSAMSLADQFKRTAIRRPGEHHESLLTMALQSHSEEEGVDAHPGLIGSRRRRSMTSNVSRASTADLTCDTGITTPARTNSASPHFRDVGFSPHVYDHDHDKHDTPLAASVAKEGMIPLQTPQIEPTPGAPQKDPAVQALVKKRCISFACAAKPVPADANAVVPAKPNDRSPQPAPTAAPRRPCIKFACPSRPAVPQTPPQDRNNTPKSRPSKSPVPGKEGSPTAVRKYRSPSVGQRSQRSTTPRRTVQTPALVRSKKYLTANKKDLQSECARFHEFASDEPQEDDWICQEAPVSGRKITINDTLEKENEIRKLGKEAEEEAEMEEEEENEDEETPNENEKENLDEERENEDDEDGELEDDFSGYGSDDDSSDGYNTDNEVGFAESDDEDENDGLTLWTNGHAGTSQLSNATPIYGRRSSFNGNHSDSSVNAHGFLRYGRSRRQGDCEQAHRPVTPELPDSTDFVCGTLDEDRPLEEAYISRIAARKREKLHPVPQDIDPSFPTSDPEDEDEGHFKRPHEGSEEHVWLHGEIEDLHHGQDRADRRGSKTHKNPSPKRYRSPPPKRHHSPTPKSRGRSPRRLFDQHSLRRHASPLPPQLVKSPPASPVHPTDGIAFKSLAFRPGLTHTKSLPRAPPMFAQLKSGRRGRAGTMTKEKHVRGAIDIFKGLEQKRQRRKEKFCQKHCDRARKGQIPVKRPLPGQGAERMRELGLLMAGKLQGGYVLSV